jgi:hypothetical protein
VRPIAAPAAAMSQRRDLGRPATGRKELTISISFIDVLC